MNEFRPPKADTAAIHASRLKAMGSEAGAICGTARRIEQEIEQVLAEGGQIAIQPQMQFLTGALARLMKDWGVVEQLQSVGVSKRRPPKG